MMHPNEVITNWIIMPIDYQELPLYVCVFIVVRLSFILVHCAERQNEGVQWRGGGGGGRWDGERQVQFLPGYVIGTVTDRMEGKERERERET